MFCCLLLGATTVGATAVIAADRTVMQADAVKDRLVAENASEAIADEMIAQFRRDNENATVDLGGTDAPPVDAVARSVVTPKFVRGELFGAVDALYAYLHSDRDDLVLAVDLAPVRDGFADAYEQWVRDAEVSELEPDSGLAGLEYSMATMAENASQFQATRQSFKEDQLERIQEETPRERSQQELEDIYDDNRDRIREEMVSRLEEQVASSGTPEALAGPMVAYGTVGIDALVAEETSYDEFVEAEAAARDTLATAVGDVVYDRVSANVPATMDLTEDMDPQARQTFDRARTAVSIADLLVYVLPLGALASAGLVGYVSRRRSNALWRVGGTVATAGLLAVVGAMTLSGVLGGMLETGGTDATAMTRAFLGVMEDTAGTLHTQSLAVLAVGLGLVALGLAVRRGLVPLRDGPPSKDSTSEESSSANSTSEESSSENSTSEEPSSGAPTDDETTDESA